MIPDTIILHHSLTKDSQTVSWDAIRRYHTQVLGWRAIGYHFGLELVGDRYEILFGRYPSEPGAHTKGWNDRAIGICIVGNFDLRRPDKEVWQKAISLVHWLMEIYNIPAERVLGHRECCDYKTCPGSMFDMDEFREELREAA